jgi:hypothetical protein
LHYYDFDFDQGEAAVAALGSSVAIRRPVRFARGGVPVNTEVITKICAPLERGSAVASYLAIKRTDLGSKGDARWSVYLEGPWQEGRRRSRSRHRGLMLPTLSPRFLCP